MNNLIWNPFIPLELMIVISVAMIVATILNKKNIINRILIIIVMFIITQRPILTSDLGFNTNMFDIMFVIDRTPSMNAVDVFDDTRLEAAKKSILEIRNKFSDAYFSIITYDAYSEMLYPLTRELDIIDNLINKMDIANPTFIADKYLYSSLNIPYFDIKQYLLTEKRDKNVKRLLFFISDGEINYNEKYAFDFSEYKSIANLIDDGAVLGYGTEDGSKIIIKQ